MKTILTVIGALVAASAITLAAPSALACGGATPIPAKTKKATTPADVIIPVKGMTCGGCANKIQVALMKLDAVISAAVDHAKGEATVHSFGLQYRAFEKLRDVAGLPLVLH